MDFWPFGVSYPRAYPRQRPSYDPFYPSHSFGPSHPSYYRDIPSQDNYPSSGLFPSYDYPFRELATPLRKQRSQKREQKLLPKKKPMNNPGYPACDHGSRPPRGGDVAARDEKSCHNSPVPSVHKTENTCNEAEHLKKANVESTMDGIIDADVVSGEEKAVEAIPSVNDDGIMEGEMKDTVTAPEDEEVVELVPSINAEEVKTRLEGIKSIETLVDLLRNRIDEFSGECGCKEQLYLTETLMSYLLQLDKILAEGNNDIRQARKQVVVKIGKYIEDIERKANKAPSNTTLNQIEPSSNTTMEQMEPLSDTAMEQIDPSSNTTMERCVEDKSVTDNVMQTESMDDLTCPSEPPSTNIDRTTAMD